MNVYIIFDIVYEVLKMKSASEYTVRRIHPWAFRILYVANKESNCNIDVARRIQESRAQKQHNTSTANANTDTNPNTQNGGQGDATRRRFSC